MAREFAFPGTQPKFAPDRVVDILHIVLELEVDPAARTVAGTATLRAAALAPTKVVELDAVELTIDEVTANGKAAAFRHDGKKLRIELAQAARSRPSELVLAITYRGCAAARPLLHRRPTTGYPDKPTQAWTQGQDEDSRYWFPCFDSPNEKATSEVIATVPARDVRAVERQRSSRIARSGGKRDGPLAARRPAQLPTW